MIHWMTTFAISLLSFVTFEPATHESRDLEWQCEKPQWTETAKIVNNHFEGQVVARCQFMALSGGGVSELSDYTLQRIQEESKEVHWGPEQVTYLGLDGFQMESTVRLNKGGFDGTIRGKHFVVSDSHSRCTHHFDSIKVKGKGLSSYVRKLFLSTEVAAIDDEGMYSVLFSTRTRIEKPFLMPKNIFLNKVKSKMENGLIASEKEAIEEIANHL